MAPRNQISCCILLAAILLALPLTNAAALDQAALLRQLIESRQAHAKSATAAGPAETDPWADRVRSFGHLPT